MTALYRYSLATTLHSQRYVAPMVFFLGLLAVLTSGDSGPLLGVYPAAAGALLACATWVAASVVNVQEPVGRAVLVVNARRSRDVLIADIAVSATLCSGMTVVGLFYPILTGSHVVTWQAVGIGALAELTCACVGIGLGLLCSRLVIGRPGYSVVVGLGLVLAVVLAKPLPPVYPMLFALNSGRTPTELFLPFLGYTATGLCVLAATAAAAQYLATRTD